METCLLLDHVGESQRAGDTKQEIEKPITSADYVAFVKKRWRINKRGNRERISSTFRGFLLAYRLSKLGRWIKIDRLKIFRDKSIIEIYTYIYIIDFKIFYSRKIVCIRPLDIIDVISKTLHELFLRRDHHRSSSYPEIGDFVPRQR